MAIRIVTDSNCDLPADLVERYGLIVVPCVLNLPDRSYLDGVDITRTQFYQMLPGLRQLPTTAAPAAGEFEQAYARCGEAEIISIHLASALSAIYNAARLGAEASGRPVTLVDSGQISMGLGWQVLAAAEVVAAGGSVAQAVAAAAAARRRLRIFAALDTLEYLRRGGRANAFTSTLGDMLQIKAILEIVDGKVISLARLRTRTRAVGKVIELAEAMGPLERLAVLHAHCAGEAQALAEQLAPRTSQPPLIIELTAVLGTHLGPGALGVAAVRMDNP